MIPGIKAPVRRRPGHEDEEDNAPRSYASVDGVVRVQLCSRNALDTPQPHRVPPMKTAEMSSMYKPILLCFLWILANIAVVMLNKFLLTSFGFKQPVLLTIFHMLGCSIFSWGLALAGVFEIKHVTCKWQAAKLGMLSAVSVLSLMLGNMSLRFLPVSFNQALGATTPVFTAIFALLLQGRKETLTTCCTLLPIVAGVVLASGAEPDLHVFGSIICLIAASFRALKTVLQAILLCKQTDKLDSMSCLAYMAPSATVLLLFAVPALEPTAGGAFLSILTQGWRLPALLLSNCVAAFMANYLNMMVTRETSALTLQVVGQAKSVILAVTSVWFFHNTVTALGWVGYMMAVCGCFAYSETKRRLMKAASDSTPIAKEGGALEHLDTKPPADKQDSLKKMASNTLNSYASDDDYRIPVLAFNPDTLPRGSHDVSVMPLLTWSHGR